MRLLIFFLTIITFSSCSKGLQPFKEGTVKRARMSASKLKKIQYYLSDPIVLWREAGSTEVAVSRKGSLKVVNGERIEEIVFKSGLPGVLLFQTDSGDFAISFDNKKDYLIFGPSSKQNGRYVLRAKKWKRNHGIITYAGKEWNTSSESAFASLLVDMSRKSKVSVKGKEARGRKVR